MFQSHASQEALRFDWFGQRFRCHLNHGVEGVDIWLNSAMLGVFEKTLCRMEVLGHRSSTMKKSFGLCGNLEVVIVAEPTLLTAEKLLHHQLAVPDKGRVETEPVGDGWCGGGCVFELSW